mmetsp:Transcript_16539/g.47978  ORF Transcript_16539/g.47978 Transcript_16539/m.47978 type:complete len:206 (+) Transcript_16539:85-702(+)|eukprot:CAMPEP_0176046564 /NCGR_PEP_ID=MMETSP0120_2-20121206/23121_1 /TAXON_ID=160619 /ORGANISM="Kryptoperidinium foliaceum, Strain CCMP 1326" /LENGTH=205 /DNA_ID=CAMNT_0017379975 /DNA_START=30 /DNA_END=647 /DNA_ORIENTATION=+
MARTRVVLRNSFLEAIAEDVSLARRSLSVPAMLREGRSEHPAVAEQLRRLNAQVAGCHRGGGRADYRPTSTETWQRRELAGASGGADHLPAGSGPHLLEHFLGGCGFYPEVDQQNSVDARSAEGILRPTRSRTRTRPCKAKRDRIKRQLADLTARVSSDPDAFVHGECSLPPCVAVDPRLRSRALAQLSQTAADAFREFARARRA